MKYDHSSFSAQRAYGSDVNQRIAQFLPMVRKLAWHYEGSGGATVDVDDLMQAGLIALTECAQRHDRPNDDGFAAYAKMRVRGAMVDLLRSQSRRPRGATAAQRKLDETRDALRSELGREPSAAETARAMALSLEEYENLRLTLAARTHSLDECYSEGDPAFRDGEPDAEARLLQVEDRAALTAAIAALPERLQLVVQLYFHEELNLTEIAAVMGVSVPRVHQLKAATLTKLKLAIAEGQAA